MGLSVMQAHLSDLLHILSQVLLIPTIIVLLVLVGYALFCIGSIVTEYFTEHRLFQVSMPTFLSSLMEAPQDEIPNVIKDSKLLNRQKDALLTVYNYCTLPGDALVALIRRLVSEEETRYNRIVGRNNTAARISPMIGLMGTLIPLGPGVEALGRADTAALSSSLLIAFDTTVAGLVVAAICLLIAKIRTNWYSDYMSALDSGMATMLEKIEEMRASGEIQERKPDNYRFLYGDASERGANAQEKADEAVETVQLTDEAADAVETAEPVEAVVEAVEVAQPVVGAVEAVVEQPVEALEAAAPEVDQLLKQPVSVDPDAVREAVAQQMSAQDAVSNETITE